MVSRRPGLQSPLNRLFRLCQTRARAFPIRLDRSDLVTDRGQLPDVVEVIPGKLNIELPEQRIKFSFDARVVWRWPVRVDLKKVPWVGCIQGVRGMDAMIR